MVMEILIQRVGYQWVQEGLTIFADDHWAAWKVEDRPALKRSLVIDALEENGLMLNAKKSAILFDLKGKDVMKELGVYVQKTEERKKMLFQSQQGQITIPVRTIFAYRDSSQLNLQHRLNKSRGQYAMPRKVIHARRVIAKQHRFRVWMAGVLTSATYGLYTVGLTATGKTQLQAMISRQLRAIAAVPAHITHVTNSEVRDQFGFKDILQQLYDQACKHCQQLEELQALQPGHICVQPVALQQLHEVIQDLAPQEQKGHPMEIRPSMTESVTCPECGLAFASLKGMRQHRAAKHKIKVANTRSFRPEVHSWGGVPQCSGCRHKFQTWCALKKRIEQGSCPQKKSYMWQTVVQSLASRLRYPVRAGRYNTWRLCKP